MPVLRRQEPDRTSIEVADQLVGCLILLRVVLNAEVTLWRVDGSTVHACGSHVWFPLLKSSGVFVAVSCIPSGPFVLW